MITGLYPNWRGKRMGSGGAKWLAASGDPPRRSLVRSWILLLSFAPAIPPIQANCTTVIGFFPMLRMGQRKTCLVIIEVPCM